MRCIHTSARAACCALRALELWCPLSRSAGTELRHICTIFMLRLLGPVPSFLPCCVVAEEQGGVTPTHKTIKVNEAPAPPAVFVLLISRVLGDACY